MLFSWIPRRVDLRISFPRHSGQYLFNEKRNTNFLPGWRWMLGFNWASIFIFSFQTVGNVHPCAAKLNFRPSFQWIEGQFEFPVPCDCDEGV